MNIEFYVYKIKEGSETKKYMEDIIKGPNEFIIVGEKMIGPKDQELTFAKVLQLRDSTITLFADMPIDALAFLIKRDELEFKGDGVGIESVTLDVPNKNLTLEVVDNIKKLNDL